MFFILDLTTKYVGPAKGYSTRRRAQNKADKLNLEYGAHRYVVVDITGRVQY